jgi:hypothetical protein
MGMVYQFSRRPRRPGSGPSDDPGAGEKTLACDQSLPLEETSFAAIVSPDTQERICLKCRRPFLSTWAGHRLCAACRFENSGIGMPNGVAPPRRRREEVSLDE